MRYCQSCRLMGTKLNNVVVSVLVGTLVSGLLATNLNAITSTATYISDNASPVAVAAETNAVKEDSTESTNTTKEEAEKASAQKKKEVAKPQPTPTEVGTMSDLDRWIERLAEKESNNRAGIKILDVNGRYSYGCLQFQLATFKSYSTRYGILDADEVISWEDELYNCAQQKQIAKRMILEKHRNWRHWAYTVLNKGIGFPPIVE